MRKLKDAAVKSAYITVAGKGTKLGRIARSIPKPLFLLGKSPIVDFIVKELIQAGIESIYFI
ncbi:MAG: hypothetical protein IMY67_10105, partial [Bacteroidetes bacterium]|nr:hypothetical protein [Bacteroidota bacterium]